MGIGEQDIPQLARETQWLAPVSHPVGSTAGRPGCCFQPFTVYAAQPFLTLKLKVAGAAFMGFPWVSTEGQVIAQVEGNEFRQWVYIFSCDS